MMVGLFSNQIYCLMRIGPIRDVFKYNNHCKECEFGIKIGSRYTYYECDRRACHDKCNLECYHTTDIAHAKNFEYENGTWVEV